jgi:hypothetical protein
MNKIVPFSCWKLICLFVLVFNGCISSQSQNIYTSSFFEAGITMAPSNFLGDLGGNYGRGTTFLKDNNFPMTKLMMGAYIAFHPSQWLGIRFAGNTGKLEGDDAIIDGKGGMEEARKIRNSNFRSELREAFVVAEIYPTVFFEADPSGLFGKVRPYGLIGAGVFHFNPQGRDPKTGEWVYLKPLRTEGQGFEELPERKEYKLTQLNIPMGFGIKYFLSDRSSISLEIVHRKTFTDYIDDVSTTYVDPALFYKYLPASQAQLSERMNNKTDQSGLASSLFGPGAKRGNADMNDAYYSFGFKVGIKLNNRVENRMKNSTRCPVRNH